MSLIGAVPFLGSMLGDSGGGSGGGGFGFAGGSASADSGGDWFSTTYFGGAQKSTISTAGLLVIALIAILFFKFKSRSLKRKK